MALETSFAALLHQLVPPLSKVQFIFILQGFRGDDTRLACNIRMPLRKVVGQVHILIGNFEYPIRGRLHFLNDEDLTLLRKVVVVDWLVAGERHDQLVDTLGQRAPLV